MKKQKILYGVCGIGNGHTQRQLPLIEHFSKNADIVIFTYDSSYDFYIEHFKSNPNITVLNVAVPFYVGNSQGIDFEATEKLAKNKKDYAGINGRAIASAEKIIGTPDLVISDYEPTSADYAYKHKVPLVTIDQQSKYMVGEFPLELNGLTYVDEVARLKMFFPKASARIACSFFDVIRNKNKDEVLMFPPIIRDSVISTENDPSSPISVLVYFSSQKEFPQSLEDVVEICSCMPDANFHIFVPNKKAGLSFKNVAFYEHGDEKFGDILRSCRGIISTAGHTLLSEAMYLGIPVYAIPLAVYEQQMNAEVITINSFGIKSKTINKEELRYFMSNLSKFREAIKKDKSVLLRGDGKKKIIEFIESKYLS